MSSPNCAIIRQLLIDLNLGTSGAWPVFASHLPPTPDSAICVYDTAGLEQGRLLQTGVRVEFPGIQIRVRGRDYYATDAKAKSIASYLDAQYRVEVVMESGDAHTIINISRKGNINYLGLDPDDDRRNFNFTINAALTMEVNDD